MSISTPESSSALDFDSTEDAEFDLVGMLLDQQQQLTAAERFSKSHDDLESGDVQQHAPAQEKYYRSLMPATPPSEHQQFAFEVDLDSCSGCKACVVACHTLNGLEEDESWRKVGSITLGAPGDLNAPGNLGATGETSNQGNDPANEIQSDKIQAIGIQHVTTACHHCEDPGCLNGCPVKAYVKDPVTGIVRHLDDQCIGCKYCTMMCPYEVPKYSKRLGIVRKCDMCHNRLSAGEAPACVQSCPNEAIRIRLVDRTLENGWESSRSKETLAPGAPRSSISRPTTVYQSSRRSEFGLPQDHGIDQVAESHWPLAALLIGTQLSVGMILVERMAAAMLWIAGQPMATSITATVATASLIVGGIGLNLAPLHLGQPLRAWRVFLGLRTSWLSREAVILGKYVGVLGAAVGLLWLPMLADWLPETVNEIAADYIPSWAAKLTLGMSLPLGILGLYSSAMIYIATKRPLWRHERTLPRFGGTTLIGGAAFAIFVIGASLAYIGQSSTAANVVAGLLLLSTLSGLAWKLHWEWQIYLGPIRACDPPHDRRCRSLTTRELSKIRTARLTLGAASIGVLLIAAVGSLFVGLASVFTLACLLLACGLVLVSESLERFLYFTSVVYDRMPGTLK